jgi:hypothetical protein
MNSGFKAKKMNIGRHPLLFYSCRKNILLFAVLSLSVLIAVPLSALAEATEKDTGQTKKANSFQEALAETKALFDARLRFEHVDNEAFTETADALTYRLRVGLETGKFANTTFLVDFDHIRSFGEGFNSTRNGRINFPVVADPDTTELNRIQLVNTSLSDTKITLGRQRIKLDDDRFIGNVGWRQNEQTFDALRVENTSIKGLKIDIAYIDQVNRIFGDGSPIGRFNSDSYIVNAKYDLPIDGVKASVTGFAYLLDLGGVTRLSSETYGANLAVKKGIFDLKASYATQTDYAGNPEDFSVDYYKVQGGITKSGFNANIGYEVLEGNGTIGFSTPLATLHAFNGFADLFLATPANGLRDFYFGGGYTTKNVGPFALLKAVATYHDFNADFISQGFGSEINLVGVVKLKALKGVTFLAKYASYDADQFGADRDVFWIQTEFKF